MELAKHIKSLTGEADWPMWKRKIRDLLDYHEGALDVIDNKLIKPEPLQEGSTEAQIKEHKGKCDLYRKANSYAKSMITSSVTDEVYQKIMDKETAHDAWEALKQQFEATSKDQLFKICTEFFAFSWMSGEDVSTHIAKLKSLWNELNNGLKAKNENALPDLLLVCKTLHILPSKFETFRSSWMLLTRDEVKTFDELTMQLCMFERNFRKTENSENSTQEALVAKAFKPKKEGQISKINNKSSRKEDICNYCKKKGHWVSDCRLWIAKGRPPKSKSETKEKSNTVDTNIALVSVSEAYAIETNATNWWIDNGATKHVTNCSELFIDFKEFESPCTIQAAGKETLQALGKGTIYLLSDVDQERKKLTLEEVWYVPEISRNLFSVLAAQDKNPDSEFKSTATNCWLKVDGSKVLCGTRELCGTLYKADIKPIIPEQNVKINVAVESNSMLQLYHERWGHQDKRHVKAILEKELGIKVKTDKELCEPCIYGKIHRLPFGTRKKATKQGELMFTDVCGPFDESFQKKRYLVLFKDSYTKFRYGFIIKEKSDVKDVLKQMIAHAKKQNHEIKELLSDNGGEFDNAEVRSILQINGITQRLTAPYTPEQNGGSERDNRTIVEMARTFKYSNPEIEFPNEIWAELVTSAIYILNRTGKSSEEYISPYELWMGRKPRIKHLRTIGSTCYFHIPTQKRKKMNRKAEKGYLVGYDGDERYRIYLKEKHKVVLSRDVIFQEKSLKCEETVKLPFQSIQAKKEEDTSQIEKEDTSQIEKEDTSQIEEEESESEEYNTGVDTEEEEEEQKDSQKQPLRRCLRDRSILKRPMYLDDFDVMAVEEFKDPETFEEAVNSEQKAKWKKAMDNEIASLNENQTWELIDLPEDAKVIPCKWVFCLKKKCDGSIDKYKARLVIKGFSQRQGIDYDQTFSPVAKLGTIRSILSIAASEGMHLAQFDVSTAFLYGEVKEEIFMKQPEGYCDGTDRVCKLKRSLYGLKQAPRCWNKRFGSFISSLGFKISEADPCLYIRERNGKKLILVLYVDDGLIAATDEQDLKNFIQELKSEFKIISKNAEFFLGLEIKHEEGNIKISQRTYARKILERFNFSECKPVSTPMLKNPEISKTGKEDIKEHNFPYRQAVGALMYLMLGTRPDLAYSVGFLSRSLENPTTEDVARMKRVFRYIAGTIESGITYKNNTGKGILECFSDADFGGCTKTGRSTTGVVVTYAGGAISWLSNRQAMVTTSTTEAEIVAANEATKEIIWLKKLFQGIIKLRQTPVLQVDSSAAVRLAQNPEFHRRTKHISNKHFFVRERITEGDLGIDKISTEQQVADILTKPLPRIKLKIFCDKMGLS